MVELTERLFDDVAWGWVPISPANHGVRGVTGTISTQARRVLRAVALHSPPPLLPLHVLMLFFQISARAFLSSASRNECRIDMILLWVSERLMLRLFMLYWL